MAGLCSLIIPQNDVDTVEDILLTETAVRLLDKGAALYLMSDGKTSVLALDRPAGAFAKAWGMGGRGLEATPCAA
ncbi:MAG TPA: hypothetical protein VFH22_01835 [Rhodocyclaceae bacterium]|nr:hypothetical protein [Rhodocyclaceae bacterium]